MVERSRSFWAFPRASNGLPELNVPDSEPGFQHRAECGRGPLPDPTRLAFVRPAIGRVGRLPGWFTPPGMGRIVEKRSKRSPGALSPRNWGRVCPGAPPCMKQDLTRRPRLILGEPKPLSSGAFEATHALAKAKVGGGPNGTSSDSLYVFSNPLLHTFQQFLDWQSLYVSFGEPPSDQRIIVVAHKHIKGVPDSTRSIRSELTG